MLALCTRGSGIDYVGLNEDPQWKRSGWIFRHTPASGLFSVSAIVNRSDTWLVSQHSLCWANKHNTYAQTKHVPPPPTVSFNCTKSQEGSASSQWRRVVLAVTSSVTPLTKEGNKYHSRKNGRRTERTGDRRARSGGLNPPNLIWHGGHTNATSQFGKRTLPGGEPFDPFPSSCPDKTLTLSVAL